MKNKILFGYFTLTALLLMIGLFSCTKDQTKPAKTFDCDVINTQDNTWNLTISPIMSTSCTLPACHSSMTNAAQINLSSYTAAKSAFETRDVLCAIKQSGSCIYMPLGQPKLADSLIAKIECWMNNNYPE